MGIRRPCVRIGALTFNTRSKIDSSGADASLCIARIVAIRTLSSAEDHMSKHAWGRYERLEWRKNGQSWPWDIAWLFCDCLLRREESLYSQRLPSLTVRGLRVETWYGWRCGKMKWWVSVASLVFVSAWELYFGNVWAPMEHEWPTKDAQLSVGKGFIRDVML